MKVSPIIMIRICLFKIENKCKLLLLLNDIYVFTFRIREYNFSRNKNSFTHLY